MPQKSASTVPKKKRKKKETPSMKPTEDVWARERYVKRRTNWMWRIRPFLVPRSEPCKTCIFKDRCYRIPCDEAVMAKIAEENECPDFKSMWKQILAEDEYDWGF